MSAIREVEGITHRLFRDEILPSSQPAVFRGLAADWPAVRAPDFEDFLRRRVDDQPRDALMAPASAGGRFFYSDGMAGMNFIREPMTLAALLDRLTLLAADASPPALAMQSIPPEAAPEIAQLHRLDLVPDVRPRLWIGNRAVTALHHDIMSNIAVVMAGRRQFMLIPPEQTPNLYTGPMEFTPAGTPVSLVDPEHPDLGRFPLFEHAVGTIQTAELGPGDAIYIPYMWWHQVRALDPLSALANFWWTEGAVPHPGMAPIDALIHALLVFRTLPDEQRRAWKGMFDAKLFDANHDHIPPERRGILGEMRDDTAEALRRRLGMLMASDNRTR
jgi:hypothetical protein